MRSDDLRSRRVAVVSDAFVNGREDVLALLTERGWGIVQLPPTGLRPEGASAWLEAVAEQIVEFRRHCYTVVVVGTTSLPGLQTLPAYPPGNSIAGLEAFLGSFEGD